MKDIEKLDFLKTAFLQKANLITAFQEPLTDDQTLLIDYQLKLNAVYELVKQSQTTEELTSNLKVIEQHFMQHAWGPMVELTKNNSTKAKAILGDFYYHSELNNIDNFISTQIKFYEDQIKTNFFDKVNQAIESFLKLDKFLGKNTKNETKLDFSQQELTIKAQELVKKYNLNSIDLSQAKTTHESMDFLTLFDQNAEIAFKKLGVTNNSLGLDKTISLTLNQSGGAFYNRDSKIISFQCSRLHPSTIIHEWTHAIDNYICQKHTGENSYVGDIQNSQVKDHNDTSLAFNILKSLNQKIFNDNIEDVNKIKASKLKEGTSKFWSTLLGNQWYSLNEDKRKILLAGGVSLDINNFLSSPKTEYSHPIFQLLAKAGFNDNDKNNALLAEKLPELNVTVKPFFDDINKNLITNKSFYYLSSAMANMIKNADQFLDKATDFLSRDKHKKDNSNWNDKNYYTQPCEMLARYFESQIFPEVGRILNIKNIIPTYATKNDSDFELYKNEIIAHALGRDKIIPKINDMRKSSSENGANRPKL